MTKVIVCLTQVKPKITEVPSSKGDGTTYTVVGSTLFNDSVCECKGFEMRGNCRHIRESDEGRCLYSEPADENKPIGSVGRCPSCGETLIVYELLPEYE